MCAMRSKNEVMTQLLEFAKNEANVRAVILNGSRVNPNAPKDIFQDYDVVFSVTDPKYYLDHQDWIQPFGDLVILQQNDFTIGGKDAYIFLMQFKDGIRIDLSFHPIECIAETIQADSLTKVLLDKDHRIEPLSPPDDSSHFVKQPTRKEFDEIMNEAWWIQTYVAKGIWRDEYSLARYTHDVILQECVVKLLSWYVGMQHDWKVNVGKCGKWLKRYLPGDIYNEFAATFSGTSYDEIWSALFNAGKLIRKIGMDVAQSLHYTYPLQEDVNVTEYLKKVKALRKDAIEFK